MRRPLARAWLSLSLLCAGCLLHRAPVHTNRLLIAASRDANDNSPVTVDAVMVYDRAVLPNIAKLTAAEWFASREQLRNDFPNAFEMREWEVVPSGQIDLTRLPFRGKGVGLFVFANYRTPGDHRARLDQWSSPRVTLNARSFTVAERP